jgi:cellulose synthase/poly-beta-1,6-N-acetylglucosamine synthase-like glycosyltransferase
MPVSPETIKHIVLQMVIGFNYGILFYFIIINSVYFILLTLAAFAFVGFARKRNSQDLSQILHSYFIPPISIIVPAYNEYYTIIQTVKSLSLLHYPQFEIIVVNDGSKDDTLGILKRVFGLQLINKVYRKSLETARIRGIYLSKQYSNLIVIDKENGGRSDAMNAGLNVAKYPLFCAVDADSILEDDSLLRVVVPFLEDPALTVGVGGSIRLANGCEIVAGRVKTVKFPKNRYAAFQNVEYLRAFLWGRVGWDVLKCLFLISGAFGVFDKRTVIMAGGYSTTTVGEDMELVLRIHRYLRAHKIKYRLRFVPDPVCWTEGPETYGLLSSQRNRWQRGLMESLWMNKRMLMNPRYGVLGMLVMPYLVFIELVGGILEIPGYICIILSYYFGLMNMDFFIYFLLIAFLFGVILSMGAVVLEEFSFRKFPKLGDLLRLFLYSILENFGYRQMYAWWRFKGTIQKFRGASSWGHMERRGFTR